MSADDLRKLVGRLDRAGVESLRIGGAGGDDVVLTSKDARSLKDADPKEVVRAAKRLKSGNASEAEEEQKTEVIEIDGDLVSFDKQKRTGKIAVSSGPINPGTYPFKLVDASVENAVLGMLRSRLKVRCYVTRLRSRIRLDVVGIEEQRALGAS